MIVESFIRQSFELRPIEVEVQLLPGIPAIHVLGLADVHIKESALRIKSAIKSQGFRFPAAQQIVVQLRPSHVKKTSQGLDLAIAAAILWETKQIPKPASAPCLYGSLTLTGDVLPPEDSALIPRLENPVVVSARSKYLTQKALHVTTLRDLTHPQVSASEQPARPTRPPCPELNIPLDVGRAALASVVARLPLLLAGPQGSGKSTLARSVFHLLPEPDPQDLESIQRIGTLFDEHRTWRPLVTPHHSVTIASMLGGGSQSAPGEITRSHRGLLILDELLEYKDHIQDSLRESTENGEIYLARARSRSQFPAQFWLVATTNLCKCGKFVPDLEHECGCGNRRRRDYLSRLSGPWLDRFGVTLFSHGWRTDPKTVSLVSLVEMSEATHVYRLERLARQRDEPDFGAPGFLLSLSPRREAQVRKLARALADIDQKPKPTPHHWNEAFEISVISKAKLEKAENYF